MNQNLSAIALGAIMLSFSPVFVNLAHVGPTMAGFYRMLVGGIIFLASILVLKVRLWQGKNHFLLALSCSLLFTLDLFLWHRSIYYVGPGLATLLSSFQVFCLAGFSIFILKEKVNWKLMLAIILAVGGLYLIVGIDWHLMNSLSRKGVIFGLITAICYAAYLLILRKTQAGRTDLSERNLATLTLITLLNLFFMACLAVITRESFNIPDAQSWLALLGYGVISQALAWVLICAGMAKVPLSQVGLLLILQPALAFIWDLLFFGRPTPPEEFIGVILVIFGIYLGTSYSSPPQKYGDNPRES